MKKELSVLKACLQAAGKVVRKHYGKVGYELKGKANLVTKADVASQRVILDLIKKNFPQHDFLAEEGGLKNTRAEYTWVVDPIDGTTNFAHTFPQCSVSVALFKKNEPVLGGVYNPVTKEMFLAQKGKGATLNGKKIHVSKTAELQNALLITGFPYNREKIMPQLLKTFQAFMFNSHDIRRLGSAALDLCWLAAGRADGYWEQNLNPWDVSAGILILREAGGKVTDYAGKPFKKLPDYGKTMIASNGKIHKQMVGLLQESLQK